MKPKGRTPDYNVKAMMKDTGTKTRIGAAWINPNGTISMVLDPFISLQSSPALLITLFPWDGGQPEKEQQ